MRWIVLAATLVAVAILGVAFLAPRPQQAAVTAEAPAPTLAWNAPAPGWVAPAYGPPSSENCHDAARFQQAAARNAAEVDTLPFSPFKRPETGWRTYVPHIAAEIGSTCAPDSPGFANALAGWQRANRLPETGVMDAATFDAMRVKWHLKRPFVILNRTVGCPPAPPPAALTDARPDEVYGGKAIQVRADALAAYRRMVAEAKAADPAIAREVNALRIFSGFRSPESDEARCLELGGCDNISRAPCSAHRTGLAFDIVVGAGPGGRVDSTDNATRLAQSRTPAYRWLVRNAGRFGFVNYVYEPWHWEWSPPEQRGARRA